MCPSCIVDGQMIRAGGTSMAAPMISGVVALMLQYFPSLTPDQGLTPNTLVDAATGDIDYTRSSWSRSSWSTSWDK